MNRKGYCATIVAIYNSYVVRSFNTHEFAIVRYWVIDTIKCEYIGKRGRVMKVIRYLDPVRVKATKFENYFSLFSFHNIISN